MPLFCQNHHNWNALLAVAKIHYLFHKMHPREKVLRMIIIFGFNSGLVATPLW
jgi:hypothetical protein